MDNDTCVVIFPSIHSRGMMPLLASNVRRILRIKEQGFDGITRDGPVLVVSAHDPVFASSAIALLSGVEKVAIAKRTKKDPGTLAPVIADVGSRLLLSTDRFLVRVEGIAKGFVPEDVETAATSAILDGKRHGAGPGTPQRHDKLLYAFLAGGSAYVCIFTDKCAGGLPYGAQRRDAVCCVHDELSAVSCYETLRQGYRIRMAVCYSGQAELIRAAKAISRIIPRTASREVEINFYRMRQWSGGYLGRTAASVAVSLRLADGLRLRHVSLPVSPLVHPADYVDECVAGVVERGLVPVMPLGGMGDDLLNAARRIGLDDKSIRSMERVAGHRTGRTKMYAGADTHNAVESERRILVRPGPNNVHDMLDALQAGRP